MILIMTYYFYPPTTNSYSSPAGHRHSTHEKLYAMLFRRYDHFTADFDDLYDLFSREIAADADIITQAPKSLDGIPSSTQCARDHFGERTYLM
jgi:hypothetical protein